MSLFTSRFLRTTSCLNSQRRLIVLITAIIFCSLLAENNLSAQGNLLITPRRVVFDGKQRTMDLNLANAGKDTATYAISLVQIRMTKEGAFEKITEPDSGQNFASQYLRYFPRRVTLAPNEAQVVKIQVNKYNELTQGEYRSHFYFRAIDNSKPLGEEELVKDTTVISVVIKPIFGITIPAIIRVGESTATVSLSDLALEMKNDTIPEMNVIFNRSGNMSVYGDLSIDHIAADGKITNVGKANGIAVYTPNKLRSFRLNLQKNTGVDFHSGKLVVTFSTPSDTKHEKLAEAELQLK